MSKNPETDIQHDILCALSLFEGQSGYKVYRMNNGGVWSRKANCYMQPGPWHPVGLADIMILCQGGKVVFMEVKTPTGTQLPSQVEFEKVCKRCGAPYAIVRSSKEALDVLRKAGIIGGELDRLGK